MIDLIRIDKAAPEEIKISEMYILLLLLCEKYGQRVKSKELKFRINLRSELSCAIIVTGFYHHIPWMIGFRTFVEFLSSSELISYRANGRNVEVTLVDVKKPDEKYFNQVQEKALRHLKEFKIRNRDLIPEVQTANP